MTSQPQDKELKALFREGRSWGADRLADNDRSRRVAWIIAGVAATIAALEAVALAGLIPLKTVVPMAVLVDRQTGHVTAIDPAQPTRLGGDAALTRSMLAQYVTARETVDRSSVSEDYRKTVLWSAGSARTAYLAQMKPGSPGNPYAQVRGTETVRVSIRSVSTLEPGTALVRFDLLRGFGAGAQTAQQSYVAVIRYGYRQRNLTEADRFTNPLGFEVTSYRRDAESPPPAPAPQTVPLPGQPNPSTQPTATLP